MFSFQDYFLIGSAVLLCISGIFALKKGETTASDDCGPTKHYQGSSAYLLGVFWLVLGLLVLIAYLIDYLGYVDLDYYINFAKEIWLTY